MTVMKEETFSPIIPVNKVNSDEEAIKLMHNTSYCLTVSIWTKDIQKGSELVKRLEAGTMFMNRSDYPNPICTNPALGSSTTY